MNSHLLTKIALESFPELQTTGRGDGQSDLCCYRMIKFSITVHKRTSLKECVSMQDEVRREIDERLWGALKHLPFFNQKSKSYADTLGLPQNKSLNKPSLCIQLEFPELPETEIPAERVLLMKGKDDFQPWQLVAEYEFAFGTLFNAVFLMLGGNLDLYSERDVAEKWEEIEDVVRLKQMMREVLGGKESRKVDKLKMLLIANMYRFTPESISTEKYPTPFYIDSLASIVFHTFYDWDNAYKSPPMIKRCKTCNKFFFPRNGNQGYCDFPNPDPTLGGMSCREAKWTRATREGSKKGTLDNMLKTTRRNYEERVDQSTDWKHEFNMAYDKAYKLLKNDPWKYTKLVEWVKEYRAKSTYREEKRKSE